MIIEYIFFSPLWFVWFKGKKVGGNKIMQINE
jgi:hypothetical protein